MPNNNKTLLCAQKNKRDEFFTQYKDVENELLHYESYLAGKHIFCNCNDAEDGAFFSYFSNNFDRLKLRKVSAVSLASGGMPAVCTEKTSRGTVRRILDGDGTYNSSESLAVLKDADIIVTNPPFSRFIDFIILLLEYNKNFLIIGHQNAFGAKEIFPYMCNYTIRTGYGFPGNAGFFINRGNYEDYAAPGRHVDGAIRVPGVTWFTNLLQPNDKGFTKELRLTCKYDADKYPIYENFPAIEVSRIKEIPYDYYGEMGVPITFFYYYDPAIFEIIGLSSLLAKPITIDGKHIERPGTLYVKRDDGLKGVYTRTIVKRKTRWVHHAD